MKRVLTKTISLTLATTLLLTSCGGSSTKETTADGGTETGQGTETSQGDVTLRFFGWQPFSNDQPEEAAAAATLIKAELGYDTYFNFPEDDYEKQLASTLSSGEKYDSIYFQQGLYQSFVDQQVLTDLTPYIEASPILSDKSILPDDYLDALRQPNGEIYALPTKWEGGLVPQVRKDWLTEWGMEVPETFEDWEAYWAKCKDEKGALGISTRNLYDIQPWASGFGLTKGITRNDDETLYVSYASEEAIPMWDWFHQLYLNGTLDPNFETNSSSDFRNAYMAGSAGSVSYWQHWVGTFENKIKADASTTQTTFDTVATPPILKDGEGSLVFGELSLIAIPTNAEHPEELIKFMEFWYSDKGSILGTLGYEGIDYEMVDGQPVMTELGIEHGFNHMGSEPVNTNFVYPESVGGDPRDADELQAVEYVDKYAKSAYYPGNNKAVMDIIDKYGAMAIKGSITPEEAVQNMQKEILEEGQKNNQNFVFKK